LSKKRDRFQVERSVFLEHIQAAGLRRTSQRDLILETFLATEEHLTSEALHGIVHKKDPTIGLTTVYRTLKLLVDAGLAREVRFGDGKTYYEHHYNHEHHDHMICTGCGKVIEFFSPEIEALQDQMASNFGFTATHHSLRLWGHCSECGEAASGTLAAASGAQPRVRVRTTVN
jgi:Fur family transcriptional regulator, ferric uptake regulator